MTTYILRHGQTDYSKQYLVNGDPARAIRLNGEGVSSCRLPWSVLPLRSVHTWLASEFPRAQQTASLLMGVPAPEMIVDARLNELDYGEFEGGPFLEYGSWLDRHGGSQRPPGARESQREGIRRMLSGVHAALEHPEPRVLVCHGLLVSVLLWRRDRSPDEAMPLFFPEAPYIEPLAVDDEVLRDWIPTLLTDLDGEQPQDPEARGRAAKLRIGRGSAVATFEAPVHSPEKREPPHA
ncbi:histidine phosphatase family protein [Streptomyces ipomoeae]|uniref:Histidine phosphatase family protein n=1 Tax=Streptomyces ipomoeae TaxID=103232 RepID=A0AAE8VYK9_9ACTN|nr:histidine phosphatase family protein [Streptomyces ipomoeae]TQE27163.1 histidine phosphatase family protein [Streptomyces ipomoeae]TQE31986.1 histidine phosphatase family protein [Streptomyces ipomoeae]